MKSFKTVINEQPRQFTQRGEPPQRNCLAMSNEQIPTVIALDLGRIKIYHTT